MRDDWFDARSTFSYVDRDGDGRADPEPLRQDQFGLALGGSILRDRAFYFASFEGLRWRRPQSFLETVPAAEERAGLFDPAVYPLLRDPPAGAPLPGNIVPQSRFDPVATRLIGLWPNPNFTGSG